MLPVDLFTYAGRCIERDRNVSDDRGQELRETDLFRILFYFRFQGTFQPVSACQ